MRDFEELVAEAEAEPVDGWDFSWLDGRATEQRPSWGYQRLLADRLSRVTSALDLDTGGGEVLAGTGVPLPPTMVAAESWPPNIAVATALLAPRGVRVVATEEGASLPFEDASFELVTSRHPVDTDYREIARVLRPGGTYLSQQVGAGTVVEMSEYFLGPVPVTDGRSPRRHRQLAEEAGLEVVDLRAESLPTVFLDIGAVVYYLRKVVWIVPGFTVDRYRDRLRDLHDRIRAEGEFRTTAERFLIEARKP